ncbi:MAG: Crp/Fnr family transcriptional regulator [Pyrinomonadaceae bacterium]
MKDSQDGKASNHILASLSPEAYERLSPNVEPIDLPTGMLLFRPGDPIEHVYFPSSAMISVVAYTDDGEGTEVGIVSEEGAVGYEGLLGPGKVLNEHMVQIAGKGHRAPLSLLRKEFKRGESLRNVILHFVRKMMTHISQTALCNRLHPAQQRLSRWLLTCQDRTGLAILPLTQEFLALMLGTNRSTVTIMCVELFKMGFISYTRGEIRIVNRPGLEAFSCPCYKTIQAAYSENFQSASLASS